jgi:hypothetical protein
MVVSKITTRSFSDVVGVVMALFLPVECAAQGAMGFVLQPLSAQAQTPSRPSGAGKQKERAQNEGGRRRGRAGRLSDRANGLTRCHASNFAFNPQISPQDCGNRLNPRYP